MCWRQEIKGWCDMKAAILYKPKTPLVIEDIEIPEPKENEVRVKMVATALCHTDLHAIKGDIPVPTPIVLGHEGAGVIDKVGAGVKNSKEGEHVITTFCPACGECRYCQTGRPTVCPRGQSTWFLGMMLDGTKRLKNKDGKSLNHFFAQSSFAEYCIVHKSAAIRIRKDAPLDKVAVFGCGVSTGVSAVFNTARVAPGSSVAVFGCGGVGLSALMASKISGASKIIAVDLLDKKLETAKQLGATDVLNASSQNPAVGIQKLTGGGVDFAFECVGSTKVMETAFDSTAPGGMAVVVGAAPVGSKISVNATLLLAERKLAGTLGGSINPAVDIPKYVDMYMNGQLPVDKIITHRFSLEQINTALEAMEKGEMTKGVVVF